jgi:hypothetical protein
VFFKSDSSGHVKMTVDAVDDGRECAMQGDVGGSFSPIDPESNPPMSMWLEVAGLDRRLWEQ